MICLNWQSELPACQEERLLCCYVPDHWLWLALRYSWAITLFSLLTCHLQVIAFGQMASWQHGNVTVAWLFPTPPKSASGYTKSLFFSFLLPPSTTNQFTQKSIVSTTGELLRLGTSSTRVPTFQWAKLDQSIECPCWGCPYQGNMTMQVQCDSSSWSFLVRRNQISSNASRARLTSELGRNARHFDCLELFLSGRCSQDGLLKK